MYEVFLLCANQTVSLQLVMNVLRWIVLLHCICRESNCCLSVYLTLLAYDSPGKTFWGPGKSWNFL